MRKRRGQSLIELLIAIAIGVIMVAAAAAVITPSLKIATTSTRAQVSGALGKELLENVRGWGEENWNNIAALQRGASNPYYLNTSTSPFVVVTGTEAITIGSTTYTRYFYVDPVYRTSIVNGMIDPAGTVSDPSTLKVTVAYTWPQAATKTIAEYLARYQNGALIQTDWGAGPASGTIVTSSPTSFQTSTNINYTTTTGSIIISL